jgi:uncharacterized protein (TIGR02246 family)
LTGLADGHTVLPTGRSAGDLAEINALLVRYVVAYDAGDIDGILATFTPEATYSTFLGSFRGHAEIRKNFVELVSRYEKTAHLLANTTVRLTSEGTAQACSYVHAAVQTIDGLAYAFVGGYDDELRQHEGRWRIQRRDVHDGIAYTIAAIVPSDRLGHRE